MSLFTKAPKTQAETQPAYTGVQLQTSSYGKAITLAYGTTRIQINIIWYDNFRSVPHTSSQSGGKGGSQSGSSTTYTYRAGVLYGLCYGPIKGVVNTYFGKGKGTLASNKFALFTGTTPQTPWAYLETAYPAASFAYNGLAYVASGSLELGSNPSLQNYNFAVQALFSDSVNGLDADPSLIIADILSNPRYGAGFPAARVDTLSTYQSYTLAAGLLLSFSLSSQTEAASTLADIASATNSEFVWSNGILTIVPYGDATLSGNGQTYTPPSAPLYDLTDDDFVVSAGDPVMLTRGRASDAINSVQLEYDNRSRDYATDVVEAKDQAAIDRFGLRQNTINSTHFFADGNAARVSVQLQLQRQSVRNVYTFTTDDRYLLLDPMDIITLTDAGLGLNRQWVRIRDITENADRTLTFTAEQYLNGSGSAATYSFASGTGSIVDHNEDPGDANTPIIFDAPVEIALTSGLEVWLAASGGTLWGGADVYIASEADADTYKIAGRILGNARQGTILGLASGTDPDTAHTLSVDLSESRSDMFSGTQADADLGNTLCYVDGELIAYQTATLTAANKYDLTYLRRGMYGTAIGPHASGTQFARLDGGIFKYGYDKSQIGQTIYVKLVSFNVYQGGNQSLADVSPYSYVIQGPPPPPAVANFLVQQNGNSVNFTWSQVSDFALKGYDIGYAPMGTTDWHLFTLLTEASKGTEMTNAAVPSGTWSFGIRARDVADQLGLLSTFDLVIENNNDTTTVQQQEPGWAGTLVGFVRHWTGVLVPDSTSLANAYSDYTLFNNFVTDPVSEAYYITPTYDIGFVNSLRIHSAYQITAGPGQSGGAAATTALDAWTTGSDPAAYIPWTVGTVPVRYVKMKIIYDPIPGSVGYLNDFTYTVDRSPLIEQVQSQAIAAGGTTITFPQAFHVIPYVTPTVIASSALYATASSITTTTAVIHVWNSSGSDVGGTVTITAKGY